MTVYLTTTQRYVFIGDLKEDSILLQKEKVEDSKGWLN